MPLAERVRALAGAGSIGFTPGSFAKIGEVRTLLAPGTTVRIGWPSDKVTPDRLIATAKAAREQEMAPFALVPARRLASETEARDYLHRLVTEAGVRDIQLVAGDREPPRGPFRDSLDVLDSGILETAGLARVGVAAHPGGHPHADDAELRRALRVKQAWHERTGIRVRARTQVVFDAAAVPTWAREVLWAEAPSLDLEVGVCGPVPLSEAVAYAHRCSGELGVHEVARAEGIDPADPPDREFDAGRALVTLARWLETDPATPLAGLMINQFGGTERTCRWLSAVQAGDFEVDHDTILVSENWRDL